MTAARRVPTVLLAAALALAPATSASPQRAGRAAAGPRAPIGWRIGLDVSTQSESNARFIGSNVVGDLETRVSGEAAGSINGARGRMELSAGADVLRYRTLQDLDRFNFDFGLRADRTFSPRLSMQLDARIRNASSVDVTQDENAADALLLPYTLSRTRSLGSTATYKMSPSTDATIEASYMSTDFESAALVGGSALIGRVGVLRRYSSSSSVALLGDASFTSNEDRSIDVSTLAAEWSTAVKSLQLRLHAGVSSLSTSDSRVATLVPVGEAEARHSWLGGTFALHYARSALQSFGLGRALTGDQIGLEHDRIWFGGVVVRAAADQGWLADPTAPGLQLRTSTILAEARKNVGGGLWVAVGGFFRRRSQESVVENRGVIVTAGYSRSR